MVEFALLPSLFLVALPFGGGAGAMWGNARKMDWAQALLQLLTVERSYLYLRYLHMSHFEQACRGGEGRDG